MASIRLDILKDLADQLVGVRKEIDDITRAASQAESAIGGMAKSVGGGGGSRASKSVKIVPDAFSVPESVQRTTHDYRYGDPLSRDLLTPLDPRYNFTQYAPGTKGPMDLSPPVAGFQSQKQRIQSMIGGDPGMTMQELSGVRLGQLNQANQAKKTEDLISRMSGGSATDQIIGGELKNLAGKFKEQADTVAKITEEIKGMAKDDANLSLKKSQLARAIDKAIQSREQLTAAEQAAADIVGAGGGGGPSGPGGGGRWSRFKNFMGGIGGAASAIGVAQAVGQIGLTAADMYQQGQRQALFSDLQSAQAAGASEATRFSRELGAMDMTRGENVMRNFGNYMNPGANYSYIGTNGRKRAMEEAKRINNNQMLIEEQQSNITLAKGGLKALGIGAAAWGGFQTGSLLAAGALATGIGAPAAPFLPFIGAATATVAALSAANLGGSVSEYGENLAVRSRGGIAGTWIGGKMYGDKAAAMAAGVSEATWTQQQLREEQNRNILQDSELQSATARREAMGYDEYRKGFAVRMAGASGAGRYSVSGYEGIEALAKKIPILQLPTVSGAALVSDMSRAGSGDLASRLRKRWGGNAADVASTEQTLTDRSNELIEMSASRQMSMSQFAGVQNMLTGRLGGGAASMTMAGRFVDLSRAGLGSQEQLAGNLSSLQAVGGTQNNLKQLEAVLSNAVASGFNKADFAQRFVATVAELASSLKTSDTNRMATTLAATSMALSGGNKGDILGMQLAQQGMSQVGGYTGQNTGLVGTMKAYALFGAGGTMAGGANLISGMNAYQLGSAIEGIDTGKMSTDPRISNAVRSSRMDVSKRMFGKEFTSLSATQQGQVMASVRGQFAATQNAAWSPVRGVVNAAASSNTAYTELLEKGKSALRSGNKEQYQEVLARVAALGPVNGMDSMGVTAGFAQEVSQGITSGRLSAKARQGALNEAVSAGTANLRDPASVARTRFISQFSATAARDFNKSVNSPALRSYFDKDAMGEALSVTLKNDKGKEYVETIKSFEDFQRLSKDNQTSALGQITTGRLIAGQQAKIAEAEGTQQIIGGFSRPALNDLTVAIKDAMVGRDNAPSFEPGQNNKRAAQQ